MSEVALYRPETDTWVDVVADVVKLAQHVAETEFVPRALRGNPAGIAAAILHGREVGLSPMTALAQTHVIEGRPTMSAEGQRALALAAGHEIEFVETTDALVTVRGRRAGGERWTTVTWTVDRARRANLLGKTNWRNHPREMLEARASAELCRLIFPDVLHGIGSTEEMTDVDVGANGAETPSSGRTRRVERRPAPAPPSIPPPPPPPIPEAPEADARVESPDANPDPENVTPAQLKMLGALWGKFAVKDEERRVFTAELVGRDLDGTTKNLTKAEASDLITGLGSLVAEADGDTDRARELLYALLERVGGGGEQDA